MKTYTMYLIVCTAYLAVLAFAANYLGVNIAEMFNTLRRF
jgi:hypothetical protein